MNLAAWAERNGVAWVTKDHSLATGATLHTLITAGTLVESAAETVATACRTAGRPTQRFNWKVDR